MLALDIVYSKLVYTTVYHILYTLLVFILNMYLVMVKVK